MTVRNRTAATDTDEVLVRVARPILEQLATRGSEPVVILAITSNDDGTHDMILRSVERDLTRLQRYGEALRAIQGPGDLGHWMEVYRNAGGGYEGLQAIAEEALRDAV